MTGWLLPPDRPDWRWTSVTDLCRIAPSTAGGRLSKEDEPTRSLYAFKRAFDAGRDVDPILKNAHTIYVQRPQLRQYLEAYLLAGASDEQIGQRLWCHPEVVSAYHTAFFNVRPGIDHPEWICEVIFRGSPHRGSHAKDHHGLLLRLGWLGGSALLQMMSGKHEAKDPEDAQRQILLLMQTNLYKRGLEMSFGSSHDADEAAFVITLLEKASDSSKSGSTADKITRNINQCLVTARDYLRLADPTAPGNLPTAREPRVADLLAVR